MHLQVALILEKIARGIVHRCFSAFVRYHALAAEERAAEAALRARLGALDEVNTACMLLYCDCVTAEQPIDVAVCCGCCRRRSGTMLSPRAWSARCPHQAQREPTKARYRAHWGCIEIAAQES